MRFSEVRIDNPVLRRTPRKSGPAAGVDGTVLVSLTDFQIETYRDLLRVVRTGLAIQRKWSAREGSLGLALWVQPLRRRLGSLSAWQSEQALERWLRSPEHLSVVRQHRGHMRNVSSDSWQTDAFGVDVAWQEVARRWSAVEEG